MDSEHRECGRHSSYGPFSLFLEAVSSPRAHLLKEGEALLERWLRRLKVIHFLGRTLCYREKT